MSMNDTDHDTLIEISANLKNVQEDVREIKAQMPSKDSVQRAHQRIDTLQKYLIGVAAFAAIEGFAIIKMLLIDKG